MDIGDAYWQKTLQTGVGQFDRPNEHLIRGWLPVADHSDIVIHFSLVQSNMIIWYFRRLMYDPANGGVCTDRTRQDPDPGIGVCVQLGRSADEDARKRINPIKQKTGLQSGS